jgi:hypothetical protein
VTPEAIGFVGLCLAGAAVLAIVGFLDRRQDAPLGRVTPGTLRRYASPDLEEGKQ